MKHLGMLALVMLLMCVALPLGGFVLLNFWGWFIAPVIGLSITYAKACGISFVIAYYLAATTKIDSEIDVEKILTKFFTAVFYAIWSLGVGWILHQIIS